MEGTTTKEIHSHVCIPAQVTSFHGNSNIVETLKNNILSNVESLKHSLNYMLLFNSALQQARMK
jgi:hypothetical protein